MDKPGSLQIATIIAAGLAGLVSLCGLVISVFSYRLAIRNQALPMRQELYKRQADAITTLMAAVGRLNNEAIEYMAHKTHGDHPDASDLEKKRNLCKRRSRCGCPAKLVVSRSPVGHGHEFRDPVIPSAERGLGAAAGRLFRNPSA